MPLTRLVVHDHDIDEPFDVDNSKIQENTLLLVQWLPMLNNGVLYSPREWDKCLIHNFHDNELKEFKWTNIYIQWHNEWLIINF